jgi:hypothetical protein
MYSNIRKEESYTVRRKTIKRNQGRRYAKGQSINGQEKWK